MWEKSIHHATTSGTFSFTSDFFNTLDQSISGNSMDASRDGPKSQLSNKSQIFRSLKEEALQKLEPSLTRLILHIAFNEIWEQGLKRTRRKNKTVSNIARVCLKMELMLGLKVQAKVRKGFNLLAKFSKKYEMLGEKDPVKIRNHKFGTLYAHFSDKVEIRIGFDKLRKNSQLNDKIDIIAGILETIVKGKFTLPTAFQEIKSKAASFSKKEFFIQAFVLWINSRLRDCFVSIKNSQVRTPGSSVIESKSENDQSQIKDTVSQISIGNEEEKAKIVFSALEPIQRQGKVDHYGFEPFIKNKKSELVSESSNSKNTSSKIGILKFNRGVKKGGESRPGSKCNSELESNRSAKEITLKYNKKIIIQVGPALKTSSSMIQKFPAIRHTGFSEQNFCGEAVRRMPRQVLKQQVSDIADLYEITHPIFNEANEQRAKNEYISGFKFRGSSVESQISNQSSHSYSAQKLSSKKPLQFKNKKAPELRFSRTKKPSILQKKGVERKQIKTQPAIGVPHEGPINFQSMNHYFPEKTQLQRANRKLLERSPYTEFRSPKRETELPVSTRKRFYALNEDQNHQNPIVNQKDSGYLQELRDKYGKKSINRASGLQNFLDNNHSRSSSIFTNESKASGAVQFSFKPSNSPSVGRKISSNPHGQMNCKYYSPHVPKEWNYTYRSPKLYQSPSKGQNFKFQNTKQKRKLNC